MYGKKRRAPRAVPCTTSDHTGYNHQQTVRSQTGCYWWCRLCTGGRGELRGQCLAQHQIIQDTIISKQSDLRLDVTGDVVYVREEEESSEGSALHNIRSYRKPTGLKTIGYHSLFTDFLFGINSNHHQKSQYEQPHTRRIVYVAKFILCSFSRHSVHWKWVRWTYGRSVVSRLFSRRWSPMNLWIYSSMSNCSTTLPICRAILPQHHPGTRSSSARDLLSANKRPISNRGEICVFVRLGLQVSVVYFPVYKSFELLALKFMMVNCR